MGGEAALLVAAADAFDRLLHAVDPAAVGARGEAGALLLELLLEPVLPAVEAALRAPVAAVSLDAGDDPTDAPWVGLTLLMPGAGTAISGRLSLPEAAERRLTAALAGVPPGRPPLPDSLAIPVSLRVGATTLSRADLRGLRPGDGLPFDAALRARGEALAVAAEAQGWRVRMTASGADATTPRRTLGALDLEEWSAMPDDQTSADAALEDLPVRLVFEIGRLELPLGEVAAAGVGHLFPIARGNGDAMVDILANGRRFGRGEIVEVGEGAFAVRVLSLLPKAGP
ncbi:type III secretion system cytoplasmic ring protein SctQ [Roseomonas sp. CCTCC AB2023176]|uniref:type III secretion system cytoplasmic ring protein SctQ n=1 Tax=Roseomonas sp. CCTCC AB2023176 TaxID=3342640 RepID=UPI0035E0B949